MKRTMTWNGLVDRYLACSDALCEGAALSAQSAKKALRDEDFRDLRASPVLRITICGIIVTLCWLLVSCHTTGRRLPLPPHGGQAIAGLGSRTEPLYVRRDQARIVPRVPESSSGSIYAESRQPLNLFSEDGASVPGDFVTVMIPPELRFSPEKKQKSGATKGDGRAARGQSPDAGLAETLETDVAALSSDNGALLEPVTSIKMEIAGVDGGTAFLRGTKSFAGVAGANRSRSEQIDLLMTAAVPVSAIRGRTIQATDVYQIEVTRADGQRPGTYRTDGWDPVVSRSLSGYAPDLGTDYEQLRLFENRLSEQQKNLSERFQALKREQQRFKREQGEFQRRKEGTASTATGPQNPAAPAPATQTAPGSAAPPAAAADPVSSAAPAGGATP